MQHKEGFFSRYFFIHARRRRPDLVGGGKSVVLHSQRKGSSINSERHKIYQGEEIQEIKDKQKRNNQKTHKNKHRKTANELKLSQIFDCNQIYRIGKL